MFVNVRVGNMSGSSDILADTSTATPRSLFAEAGIDPSNGLPSLDGITLQAREMGMTLDELHVTSNCMLTSIVKADSAC